MSATKRRVTFDPTLPEKPESETKLISPLRGDSYVDQLLEIIPRSGEPYVIEEGIFNFKKKISVFEVRFLDGQLTGLQTLQRAGFCYLSESKGRKKIGAILDTGNLSFRLRGEIKFMNYGTTLTIHVNLSHVEFFISFNYDAETRNEAILNCFKVTEYSGLNVQVTGLGLLTWSLNVVVSNLVFLLKGYIETVIENTVRSYMRDLVPKLEFPDERYSDEAAVDKIKSKRALMKLSLKEMGRWKNDPAQVTENGSVSESHGIHREKEKPDVIGIKSNIREENGFKKLSTNGVIQNGTIQS